jgi:hypothetical protein
VFNLKKVSLGKNSFVHLLCFIHSVDIYVAKHIKDHELSYKFIYNVAINLFNLGYVSVTLFLKYCVNIFNGIIC